MADNRSTLFSACVVRFAHLISVDYFADLMSVLHSLMEHNVINAVPMNPHDVLTALLFLSLLALLFHSEPVLKGEHAVYSHCI